MTKEEIKIVQTIFIKLEPNMLDASRLFYENLFRYHPNLQPLFKGNKEAQYEKFAQILLVLIRSLENQEWIRRELASLGKQHENYGVQSAHYDIVGATLLSTIKELLGEEYTEDVDAAMISLYNFISASMLGE